MLTKVIILSMRGNSYIYNWPLGLRDQITSTSCRKCWNEATVQYLEKKADSISVKANSYNNLLFLFLTQR